jgi:anti-sigma-K factor RskA
VSNEAERLARAGNYVLGMMDAAERERAERDLLADAAFRDAVVVVAERMHLFEMPDAKAADPWATVAARLAELPQMRVMRETPGVVSLRAVEMTPLRPVDRSRNNLDARRWFGAAVVLALVFALGFVVGRF